MAISDRFAIYMYICVYIYIYIYIYMCVCVCVCVHIYVCGSLQTTYLYAMTKRILYINANTLGCPYLKSARRNYRISVGPQSNFVLRV